VAQNAAQSIFRENLYLNFTAENKVAKLFALLLQFSQKLPETNSHPISKNSPNLFAVLGFVRLHP
jgi:hypothetical protein